MGKIAVVLLAFSFLLTSCSVGSLIGGGNEIVAKINANYVDYSAELVKNTNGDKVLFFHASWCGPCKSTSKKLSEIETSTGITVFKIDYDNSAELRKKYDVTSQHTFVQIDSEWNMLAKWSGSKDLEDIKENLVESMEKDKMKDDMETKVMEGSMSDKADMMWEEKKMDDKSEMSDDTMMKDEMDKDIMENKKDMMDDAPEVAEEVTMTKQGKFVAYSAEEVASTSGDKVLFFHAKWCPSCTGAAKNLSAETAPEGLNVFKVDYDSSADLKAKYGVVSQHTFVQIDDNGTMLKRWFGSRNYEDILSQLQS